MPDAALTVSDLRKSYGSNQVLDGTSFHVARGEIYALLGSNGAGKSTTIEICEGFRNPDSGGVTALGREPGSRETSARVGVMPQDGGFYAVAKPIEAMRQFASFYPNSVAPETMLDQLDLPHSTPYRQLSVGQKQRLSLGLALIGRPDLLFCDEPTAGMDPAARADTWRFLANERARGCAILLTTHLLDEAQRSSDRVGILHGGRIAKEGTPAEILSGSGTGLWFRASAPIDVTEAAGALGGPVRPQGDGWRFDGDPDPTRVAALTTALATRGIMLEELKTGHRSLEDAFFEVINP